jgi:hypothetical protein
MTKKKITRCYQTLQAALPSAIACIHIWMIPFCGSAEGRSYRRITGTCLYSQNIIRLGHG